jgi:hypothetical protein
MNRYSKDVIIVGMYLNPVQYVILLFFFFFPFQTYLACILTVIFPVFQKTNNWSFAMNWEGSE